jgi:hypothetical protein
MPNDGSFTLARDPKGRPRPALPASGTDGCAAGGWC